MGIFGTIFGIIFGTIFGIIFGIIFSTIILILLLIEEPFFVRGCRFYYVCNRFHKFLIELYLFLCTVVYRINYPWVSRMIFNEMLRFR